MVTDTSKSLRFQKTQMFSQTIDQKEHKNNRYKLEPATWCYKHHSITQWLSTIGQTMLLSGYSSRLILLNIINVFINIVIAIITIVRPCWKQLQQCQLLDNRRWSFGRSCLRAQKVDFLC